MAKVRAPLFGLSAAGKLAGALVYFPWKGIKAVREYVIPANPSTAAQQTQRGYITQAMTDWHAVEWTDDDITAFRRWANAMASAMTHVNVYVKHHILEKIAGNTWYNLSNVATSGVGSSGFTGEADATADNTAVINWGVTPNSLHNQDTCTHAGGTYSCAVSGLQASTKYYFQIKNTAGNTAGSTGISSVTTTA